MRVASLAHLVCPYCRGGLEARFRSPATGPEIESAILACGCCEFPLLGGIPIFQRDGRVDIMRQTVDAPLVPGPEVSRLRELIRAGKGEEALALLLSSPPAWIRRALTSLPQGLRAPRRFLERLAGRQALREARDLMQRGPSSTARLALESYARRTGKTEHFHHFFYRFAQPRHLSSLAVAWSLPSGPRAALDLACGFGHTLHCWTNRNPGRAFFGVDRNFVALYIARSWVAPLAEFVCARGDDRLPFPDGFFGAILCADAFHYFRRKESAVADFRRLLAPDGVLALTRFGNARVEPREGDELDPEGYARLFEGFRYRFLEDGGILRRYVSGRLPDLSVPDGTASVTDAKWLTLVASGSDAPFRDGGPVGPWPHGLGRLRVNPLYRIAPRADGAALTLEFPSPWFEFENRECLAYMPTTIDLARRTLEDIEAQRRTPEVDDLVRRCVVLGLPEAYG